MKRPRKVIFYEALARSSEKQLDFIDYRKLDNLNLLEKKVQSREEDVSCKKYPTFGF